MLLVCSGQTSTKATELEGSKSDSNSLFGNDPNFSAKVENGRVGHDLSFRMMISVLFLIAVGAVAIYVSKKFLPKITNLPGKQIRIAETVHLGPRRAVHLVEIGERQFLIGSTNENITKLADLTGVFSGSSIGQIDNIENIDDR
ncbi:MAG: flagellar biosynthetic protein FliO [Phycisphaerales bacterium]